MKIGTDSEVQIITIAATFDRLNDLSNILEKVKLPNVIVLVMVCEKEVDTPAVIKRLSRHNQFTIHEAANNQTLEGGGLYILSSEMIPTILGSKLQLQSKRDNHGLASVALTQLLLSIAEKFGTKAIVILLVDITADLKTAVAAVKTGRGLLINSKEQIEVKNSESSGTLLEHGDVVLLPDMIGEYIGRYITLRDMNMEGMMIKNIAPFINDEEKVSINEIIDIISNQLPLDFGGYKIATIYKRVKRRAALRNIHDLKTYCEYLRANIKEVELLVKDFLISVTGFFRDKDAFKVLELKVIPEIISRADSNMIKVWVTGCATGEEAYSIAILIHEQLLKSSEFIEVKIFATDIDEDALAIASRGVYYKNIDKDMSEERLRSAFIKNGDEYTIRPEIRRMMIFARHDLVSNPPFCNLDLISCRNLLIYFNTVVQKKVFQMLHFGLKKNAYLFLGTSESVPPNFPLTEIQRGVRIFQNSIIKSYTQFESFMTPVYEPKVQSIVPVKPSAAAHSFNAESVGLLNALVNEIDASGFVVDEGNIVRHCFGDIGKYLKGKLFTLSLGDVLPEKSMEVFKAASFKSSSTGKKTVVKEFLMGSEAVGELTLLPFSHGSGRYVAALFNFKKETTQLAEYFSPADLSEYTQHLEEEVKNLKFQLDNFHQEIEASKENLQSFNGELLSANEEMQSTNEEWQSVNEELQTINAQYQLRIKELTDLNDDLDNYFRSNVNAQLFVDNNLLLKKFSPSATKHINLRPIDVGRPLTEITTHIKLTSLIEDIQAVIKTGEVVSRDFKGENEMWYQLLIMPYIKHADNKRDGAIITIYDISGLKKIEQDLDDKNARLKKINADLDDFVYTASHDLIAPLTNIEALIEVLNGKIQSGADNASEVIGRIQSAVERFKSSIHDLSDIRKIESDMLKEPDRIYFEQLTNEVRISIRDQIESAGAVIKTEFSESEIRFSRKSLRSILFNLISNAIKFSDPVRKPEIFLTTYRIPGFIVLMIKDNGLGICAEKLDSIFTMFHNLPDTFQANGLGLYLIKKIIEASNGKIEVESVVNEGTIFRVFLPFDPHMLLVQAKS